MNKDRVFQIAGAGAVLVGVSVSGYISALYGWQTGIASGTLFALAYLAIGIAAIGLEIAGAYYMVKHRENGRPVAAFVALVLALAGLSYTVLQEVGFLTGTMSKAVAEDARTLDQRESLVAERDIIRQRLGWSSGGVARQPEKPNVLEAELDALKASPNWASSDQCANATVPASISLCESIAKTRVALARSRSFHVDLDRLRDIRAELAQGAAIGEVDARASFLARATDWSEQQARDAVTIMIILILALCRFGGVFTFLSHSPGGAAVPLSAAVLEDLPENVETLRPGGGEVAEFVRWLQRKGKAGRYTQGKLYEEFAGWCKRRGIPDDDVRPVNIFLWEIKRLGAERSSNPGDRKICYTIPQGPGRTVGEIANAAA